MEKDLDLIAGHITVKELDKMLISEVSFIRVESENGYVGYGSTTPEAIINMRLNWLAEQ